jgi:hypothetical protein
MIAEEMPEGMIHGVIGFGVAERLTRATDKEKK